MNGFRNLLAASIERDRMARNGPAEARKGPAQVGLVYRRGRMEGFKRYRFPFHDGKKGGKNEGEGKTKGRKKEENKVSIVAEPSPSPPPDPMY